jgi:hypothetical protein
MTDQLLKQVNDSGFPLQLAIEELVNSSQGEHGWSETSHEHPWKDEETPRFADLILSKPLFHVHLVVECKRARGDWVFLVRDPKADRAEPRTWFRAQYMRNYSSGDGPRAVSTLDNFHVWPASWESMFCAIHGSSDHDRPMLDRVCGELTRCTDALSTQAFELDAEPAGDDWFVRKPSTLIPLVVTNVPLHVCFVDPGKIQLDGGRLQPSDARFETVTHIRYRKSFAAPTSDDQAHAETLGDFQKLSERTVSIVTAAHLTTWLREWRFKKADY